MDIVINAVISFRTIEPATLSFLLAPGLRCSDVLSTHCWSITGSGTSDWGVSLLTTSAISHRQQQQHCGQLSWYQLVGPLAAGAGWLRVSAAALAGFGCVALLTDARLTW